MQLLKITSKITLVVQFQKNALENKTNLLDYIKEQLHHKDLVKLSLCWECPKEVVDKFKVIQESIKQNAKYYFEDGKEVE